MKPTLKLKSYRIWTICFLSFFAALTYNEVNLKQLPKEKVRANQTIKTNDDYSYLVPPKNFIKKGTWVADGKSEQAHYFRPPGYGIIYLGIMKITGTTHALAILKLLQLLLFSFSVYWFYYLLNAITNHNGLSLFVSGIYGLSPFCSGFLFYTLTEGVTPSLSLLNVFLLFKAFKSDYTPKKNLFYFSAAFVFSFLFIIRPALGVLSLLLPFFIYKEYWHISITKTFSKLLFFGTIAFSLMGVWQIRNYTISNKIVGLNPIYDTQKPSLYRPPFKAYWKLTGGWAEKGHITHSVMFPFWISAINGDTNTAHIDNILKTYPDFVIAHFGKKRLSSILSKYQTVISNQQEAYLTRNLLPKEMPALEKELTNDIEQLLIEYKRNFWFQYYIISPLKIFKTMAFHSNLSFYMLQHTYRGNLFIEAIRIFFFFLHSACFLGIFISLFLRNHLNWKVIIVNLTVLTYLLFLCYYQRGLEERYTSPILPFLLIGLSATLKSLYDLKLIKNKIAS